MSLLLSKSVDRASDERHLRAAMDLARRGRGYVEPNPMVGCVIIKDGRVIGEGVHERYGGPHAEPNALADCRRRGNDPAGATIYITLEPCCHTNKKTPPCAPQVVAANPARVVIGCTDPNPQVNGSGIAQLREAGIDVTVGVLEAEARQLIAPFIARTRLNRPYVTLKWAVSADGMVAGKQGQPVRISNPAATAAVHALRGRCDAIAIGTNTLRNDDPLLTARTPDPPRRPIRVVLSNRLSFPIDRRLFVSLDEGPVLLYTADSAANTPDAAALRERGVEVIGLPATDNGRGGSRFAMPDVYADLARRGVTHLLIEPGRVLARELIARNQADRAWTIQGQITIGDAGMPASHCPWPETATVDLDGDRLTEHLNPTSPAFFAAVPSADLKLVQ